MKKIRLWKNRNELSDEYTIVDDEDYDKVVEALGKRAKWYLWKSTTGKKYAMSGCRYKSVHRVVMGNPKGMDIDHIDGDGLDNRKENLRICTRSQNCANKKVRRDSQSGYKGVCEIKKPLRKKYVSKKTGKTTYHECMPKKRFQAYISNPKTKFPKKRHISLGYFHTAEEAALAYNKAALEMYGEFAVLNQIKGKDNGG